jgi:hypothetical protein
MMSVFTIFGAKSRTDADRDGPLSICSRHSARTSNLMKSMMTAVYIASRDVADKKRGGE